MKAKNKKPVRGPGRLPGYRHDESTREKMSLAKKVRVRITYAGGTKDFESVDALCAWEFFPFKMYRRMFNLIMKNHGGKYQGIKFEYLNAETDQDDTSS